MACETNRYCIHCDGALPDTQCLFCPECGKRLECGQNSPSTATFDQRAPAKWPADHLANFPSELATNAVARPARLGGATVGCIIGGLLMMFVLAWLNSTQRGVNTQPAAPLGSSPSFDRVQPAVVTVYAKDAKGLVVSQGSGFLINATGVLVTNFHVVEGADSIQVTNHAGGTYKVTEIQAADETRDVAVLQLGRVVGDDSSTLQGLPYLAIGESGQMNRGDRVFSIGSPKGFSGTLSDGLVSATREVDEHPYIQTTVPISPGSSGAPLLNDKGTVVGMMTFRMMTGGQSLNFAIPIDTILGVLREPKRAKNDGQPVGSSPPVDSSNETHRSVGRIPQGLRHHVNQAELIAAGQSSDQDVTGLRDRHGGPPPRP